MEIKQIIVGPLATNCYLLVSENEALVIDPGDQADKILKVVGGASIKKIALTHYHFDHLNAALELKEKTKAKILIHQAEKSFLDFEADQYLEEGDFIQIGEKKLRVIHTPGHTAGSICLLIEDKIFVGDLIFAEGYGRTDLPGGSDEAMNQSLEKVSKLIETGTMVYPGHGEIFKLGH